jgi:hypothetical protein
MSERPTKRRGPLLWLAGRSRRFWIVGALLPVLYVASFGPACWISSRAKYGNLTVLPAVYLPLLEVMWSDMRIFGAFHWYADLGAASGWGWIKYSNGEWAWAKVQFP